MNLFETVKASVSVPEAARAYGLTVTRHNMTRCLFHDDRHPSLKLNPDFYYCFGCGAKGDVIDLVAGLFDLSLYEAARKIAEDFGINPDNPPKVAALAKPRHPMIRRSVMMNATVSGCFVIICTFWRTGRCSMHPLRWKKSRMTALWKPARCSPISNIWQTF